MGIRATRHALILSVCLFSLTLAGCGGGSSGSERPAPISVPPANVPSPPPPPPPPPAPGTSYNTVEYQRSSGGQMAGAISAYEAGGRGQGIKVAVVDSGINPNLPEFRGRIDPASRDVASNRGVTDQEGHGTAVSAILAAARDGSGIMGVAFDATILSLNTANPGNCADTGCRHNDADIGKAIDIAIQNGARVINISLGGEGAGGYTLAALSKATAAGIIVVVSAGNEGGANPSGFALDTLSQGNDLLIVAGAHDGNRESAAFSNKAGAAAAHYLMALGRSVLAPDEYGQLYTWNGTSFSAPVISGAAALLASAFPNLTGHQIVEILLGTADDAGAVGQDSTYGRGILNIARAFAPQGVTKAAGSGVPVSTSGNGDTSGPMGDASMAMKGVVVLDRYERAYSVDLGRTLTRALLERPLSASFAGNVRTRMSGAGPVALSLTVEQDVTGKASIGFAQMGLTYDDHREAKAIAGMAIARLTPATAAAYGFSESGRALQQRLAGHGQGAFLVARDPTARNGFHAKNASSFALRHEVAGFGLTATSESGGVYRSGPDLGTDEARYRLNGVTIDRTVAGATLTFGINNLRESETVLGGRFAGLFGSGGSSTSYLDVSAAFPVSGWALETGYRRGWTRMGAGSALVKGGRLVSDAFFFDLGRRNIWRAGDDFALRISQPLRVRSGGYDMNLPVSYDYKTGAVGYARQQLSLAPEGREIDVEAAYGVPAFGGHLSANAFYRREPGHIAAANADVGAALRFVLGL